MNRRQILQYTAWLTGGAVSTAFTGAFLFGCSDGQQAGRQPAAIAINGEMPILHFFTPEQFVLLTRLADTILPRTDSPSATDVKAHITLDSMVGQIYEKTAKETFKTGWLALQKYLDQHDFALLPHEPQIELLKALEIHAEARMAPARQTLIDVKQQLIAYYLTSEEIGEKFLNYLPIPGVYQPCISITDVNNKAWAL